MDGVLMDKIAPAEAGSSAAHPSFDPAGASSDTTMEEEPTPNKVVDLPKLDLESYISNYAGRTRFARLYFIGTTSTILAIDALKMAIAEAQCGKDAHRYEKAVRALAGLAPNEPEASVDSQWFQSTQLNAINLTDRLETELRGYKNNLIKESIRMGNEDLGNHYFATGNSVAASKAYSRMRDFCTTPNHVVSMLFKLVSVSIERGDWLSVTAYVHRLRNAQSKPDDQKLNKPKIQAAAALSFMQQRSYREAADAFLQIDNSLGDSYNDVITPNDIAVYGGLCALATMSRTELKERVLDNSNFRHFLELEPHIRRAISFFCNSKFRPCLDILEAYRADYLLDIHLQSHVPALYARVRTKSIQQYFSPFSAASLETMAAIFSPTVVGGQAQPITLDSPFVQELVELIKGDMLDARIDLDRKILVKAFSDPRMKVQDQVLRNSRDLNSELHWRLLRMQVLQARIALPAASTADDRAYQRPNDPNLPPYDDELPSEAAQTFQAS